MEYEGVVLDLDGTVYRGDSALDGAREAIATLRGRGFDILFVTNNPTRSPAGYVEKLAGLGIEADEHEIISAGTVTATYLAEEHPGAATFVVGSEGLHEQLETAGVTVTDAYEDAEVVVTSHTHGFDYRMLTEAMWALDGAGAFYGTDPDLTYPDADGREYPGSGAITRSVATVAERDPDRVLGKPSDVVANLATQRLSCPPERLLVVGDGLDTDVALGERAGMGTVLVLTGRSDRHDLERADVQPHHVVDSIGDVSALLG